MKHPSAASLPMRRYSSFLLLRADISITALILSGSTSIPL